MATESAPFLNLHSQLDLVDETLEEGPTEGEAGEAFLKRVSDCLDSAQAALRAISPDDVDEEYYEDGEDDANEEEED